MVRESLMYRYAQMRARETMLDDYWSHMCSVIRAKNPSLLLHMTQNQTPKREAFKWILNT